MHYRKEWELIITTMPKTNGPSLFSSNFNYRGDINNFMNKFINLIKC